MHFRLRASALFVCAGLLFGALLYSPETLAQMAPPQPAPFYSFIQSVQNAAPATYIGHPESRVSNAVEFERMRRHILEMYRDTRVINSFVLDGHYFDCIEVGEQPSARILGLKQIASPPPPLPGPAGSVSRPPAPQVGSEQKADEFGDSIGCTPGTIPMRRITLEDLSRFETLEKFFQKGPDGAGEFGSISPYVVATHKYAHSYQNVTNYGGSNTLNLWNPPIDTAKTQVFSLSQHWFVNFLPPGPPKGAVQTVEGGWQAYPKLYGNSIAVLFIYWTADGYDKTGCYNLSCAAFVQTNNTVFLGHGWPKYSVAGGNQYEFQLVWYLYGGNWWLAYGINNWVGYYPGDIYKAGPLTKEAVEIDFGGETVGTTSWPPMGGGSFADTGFKHAAYQRNIWYIDDKAGGAKWPTLTRSQPSPNCYTDENFNNSATAWVTYFYFGGPGGGGC